MLPLRRELLVGGQHGPAVGQNLHVVDADVDHGLDGEHHARFHPDPTTARAEVEDVGLFVETEADAVATKVPHDAVAILLRVLLDVEPDLAEVFARLDLLDANLQTLGGDGDELLGLVGDLADREHPAGVAVVTLDDASHVDVDDVTLGEDRVRRRDTVTDHLVDRGADALREAAVVQRRWDGIEPQRVVVDDRVDRFGGDARLDVLADAVEDLLGGLAGLADPRDLRLVLDDDPTNRGFSAFSVVHQFLQSTRFTRAIARRDARQLASSLLCSESRAKSGWRARVS